MKPEQVLREIERLPDDLQREVLDFVLFLQSRFGHDSEETAFLSEASLGKDWLRPEEERAWADL